MSNHYIIHEVNYNAVLNNGDIISIGKYFHNYCDASGPVVGSSYNSATYVGYSTESAQLFDDPAVGYDAPTRFIDFFTNADLYGYLNEPSQNQRSADIERVLCLCNIRYESVVGFIVVTNEFTSGRYRDDGKDYENLQIDVIRKSESKSISQ